MDPTVPASRPDAGDLKVGDLVWVIRFSGKLLPATVTKVARVWMTVEDRSGGYPRTWKFRIATQSNDSSRSAPRENFLTPDQKVFRDATLAAIEYLKSQKIAVGYDSPWLHRQIELARIIWGATHTPNKE